MPVQCLIRHVILSAVALSLWALPAASGVLDQSFAEDGLKPIQQVGRWTILSDDGSCVAELVYPQMELAFQSFGPVTVVIIVARDWSMSKRRGWLGLHPKPNGHFVEIEPAQFGPRSVTTSTGTQILQSFFAKWIAAKATSLELQDDRGHVMASIPIPDFAKAIKSWNACVASR